ncbi:MAG TPA: hypothetical protein VF598_12235, partial [Hymenobacter sp.]
DERAVARSCNISNQTTAGVFAGRTAAPLKVGSLYSILIFRVVSQKNKNTLNALLEKEAYAKYSTGFLFFACH